MGPATELGLPFDVDDASAPHEGLGRYAGGLAEAEVPHLIDGQAVHLTDHGALHVLSLCFEQSYEGIDGDSASSTELHAILPSLSGVPIKQGVAVTGSVNQNGEVQAIGGVNRKIEGFFDVCRRRGLTGEQGVLVPRANLKNLMLRQDVVEVVEQGQFQVYAIGTVDEGIKILTGLPAGGKDAEGRYPENSINGLVQKQLREYSEGLKRFTAPEPRRDAELEE